MEGSSSQANTWSWRLTGAAVVVSCAVLTLVVSVLQSPTGNWLLNRNTIMPLLLCATVMSELAGSKLSSRRPRNALRVTSYAAIGGMLFVLVHRLIP